MLQAYCCCGKFQCKFWRTFSTMLRNLKQESCVCMVSGGKETKGRKKERVIGFWWLLLFIKRSPTAPCWRKVEGIFKSYRGDWGYHWNFANNGSLSETALFKSSYSEIPLPGLDHNEMESQNTETKICWIFIYLCGLSSFSLQIFPYPLARCSARKWLEALPGSQSAIREAQSCGLTHPSPSQPTCFLF